MVAPARSSDDPDWLVLLTQDLLCEATHWNAADVPRSSDSSGDGPVLAPEEITQEHLECLCGFGGWEEAAAGQETSSRSPRHPATPTPTRRRGVGQSSCRQGVTFWCCLTGADGAG
jgi:hypothetical protein